MDFGGRLSPSVSVGISIALAACSDRSAESEVSPLFEPTAVVDLGALVTEDLAQSLGSIP